jgi:hypothetical protein
MSVGPKHEQRNNIADHHTRITSSVHIIHHTSHALSPRALSTAQGLGTA